MGACESNTVPVQVDETVKVKEVQIPTPVPCPAKEPVVETKKVVVDDIKPRNSPRRRPQPAFKMNAAQRKAAAWKQRVAEGIAGKFTQMKLAELEANEKKEKAEWSSSDEAEDANNDNNVDTRTNQDLDDKGVGLEDEAAVYNPDYSPISPGHTHVSLTLNSTMLEDPGPDQEDDAKSDVLQVSRPTPG